MPSKRKYTQSQKKAYYSGMGYRVARMNKAVPFKNESNKESFRAGFQAAQQYPDLPKPQTPKKKKSSGTKKNSK